jgi:hypothetical protein
VPPKLNGPIPLEALRDLIGICRALYAAWKASGAGPIELDELLEVGKDLREAYRLARNTPPNTLGHRAAWSRAEAATQRLGHLVSELERLQPVVAAATRRVLAGGTKPTGGVPGVSEREAKRQARRTRS